MRAIEILLVGVVLLAALAWAREPSLDRLVVTLAASAAAVQVSPRDHPKV